ncbi:MAG: hypothetical protein R3B06_29435 [Kofleriaceae bacterium]
MSPLPPTAAVIGLVAVACQAAPPSAEAGVRVRGDGDQVTLLRTAAGCDADGSEIRVHDGEAHGGGWHLTPRRRRTGLSHPMAPSWWPGSSTMRGRRRCAHPLGSGRRAAGPDHRDRRHAPAVAGADRTAVGTLAAPAPSCAGGGGATRSATITGTDDLLLGATLVAPSSLPVAGRAVVACARLAATVPSPAK